MRTAKGSAHRLNRTTRLAQSKPASSMASFKLNSYDPAVTQKKGLKIRYKDFDGNLRTALIDYTE